MNRKIALVFLLPCIALSCVSAGKYHQLEDEDNQAKQELGMSKARVAELEDKLGIASTEKSKLEGNVAEMQTALADLQKRKQETEKRLADFQELTDKFKKLVDAGKLTVRVVNGRMQIGLSTDVLFPSG